jgi:hypothetical protein
MIMIKYLCVLIFTFSCLTCLAQDTVMIGKIIPKKNQPDTTVFPIHGIFKINETGFFLFKNLELWVYDANNREILYVSQNIPTSDAYNDVVDKMIDHEYTALMMKHGHIIDKKSLSGPVIME